MVRVNLRDSFGTQIRVPLDVWVKAGEWDERTRRVRFGKHNCAPAFNSKILAAVSKLENLITENPDLSPQQIRTAFDEPEHRSVPFWKLASMDLDETPPESWHTVKQRRSAITRFGAVYPEHPIQRITPLIMEQYRAHLLTTGISSNTAAVQLRQLRTMYRRVCRKLGRAPAPILDGVDAVERYSEVPEQLTVHEVERLHRYEEANTGWAAKAVTMWLASLYCGGIRWGDLCRLTTDNIRDGRLGYIMSKVKGKPRNILLLPQAKKLMDRFREGKMLFGIAGDEVPSDGRIAGANVIANRELKKAALACGIERTLRTHNARHSFAAMALSMGQDDRLIQEIMGLGDKAYKHYRGRFGQQSVDEGLYRVFAGHGDIPTGLTPHESERAA